MEREQFRINTGNSVFNCIRLGNGGRLLICLHGFGETAEGFGCFAPLAENGYMIVAVDLPFHGSTEWNEGLFTPANLAEVISSLQDRFQQKSFSLIGYSMGGRLCLCLTEKLFNQPDQLNPINQLILLAPDGLKNNPWYVFATRTFVGRRLFYYSAVHPRFFMRLLDYWRRLGLMNASIYKFISGRMDTVEKRKRVYEVWTAMKQMNPGKKNLKTLIRKHNLPVLLLFGKYDRVIPPSLGAGFCRGLPSCRCVVMETGHRLLTEEAVLVIKKQLDGR